MFVLGFAAIVCVGRAAAKRLGLEPWAVLIWFGLAEAPVDELAAKRAAAGRRQVSRALPT
jgi:hypothetical protein